MPKLLQGSERSLPGHFYKIPIKFIKNKDKILNLGSGTNLTFEKLLSVERKVNISCLDIVSLKPRPKFIHKFITQSAEEDFLLRERFDVITFFELIEHVDNTDVLIKNCYKNLKKNGLLVFSFPNLASIYSRIEIMLGFQPHILEISNENVFGTGFFGHINWKANYEPLHHIRGFTYKAMKEFVKYHGFEIEKEMGYDWRLKKLFMMFPSVAPVCIFVCRKCDKSNR